MIHRLLALVRLIYDVKPLIQWGGLTLVGAVVFAETGLLAGFFLPGDSLLVTAGIFARTGDIRLAWLLAAASACAVAGDQTGYAIGFKAGQALYRRPDSLFFKKKHLERTRDFYERYGAKTIVIARFIPIVRTFAPVVAGIGAMNYRRFVSYNVIGGLCWVWTAVLGGYFLASMIPNVEKSLHKIILAVILLSILPGIVEYFRERRRARAEGVPA